MTVDFTALAIALGGTVNTKSVTEFVFGNGRKVLFESLIEMEERAAVQFLTGVALPPSVVTR